MTDAQIPHFAFPFRFGETGSAEVVEQETFSEIEQNVLVLVLTDRGERLEVPDFGVSDPTFALNIDTEAIVEASREWDERVEVLVEEGSEAMVRNLRIRVGEGHQL